MVGRRPVIAGVRWLKVGKTFMMSFIIPAYNEQDLIGRTLSAVHEAARTLGEAYEIIVVDDASSDRTADIAAAQGARVVTVNHRQIAATRNAGARAAKGERFVFVDADTEVSAAVVRATVTAMQQGAIGGGCRFRFDGALPLYGRCLERLAVFLYRRARLASGSFLFCTRAAFEAVGGFDEELYAAEEVAMSTALKRHGQFVVLPEAVTTSGRKLRAYSGLEVLRMVGRLVRAGNAGRQREGLELWYGERRPDPQPPNKRVALDPGPVAVLKKPERPRSGRGQ
jgi:glycosyltransferase involved in cell wall biosynthesis